MASDNKYDQHFNGANDAAYQAGRELAQLFSSGELATPAPAPWFDNARQTNAQRITRSIHVINDKEYIVTEMTEYFQDNFFTKGR